MKPLVGLLLVVSGTVLATPPLYEVLAYLDYEGWPVVAGVLGITSIVVGLVFLTYRPRGKRGGIISIG